MNAAFDSESIITPVSSFYSDLVSSGDIYMFYVSFTKSNKEFPKIGEMIFPDKVTASSSDIAYKILHKIKVDRYNEDIFLIDFSGSGISGIANGDLKLDDNTKWRFYYLTSKNHNDLKVAFDISVSNLSSYNLLPNELNLLNYTRNLLILDLSKIHPRCNFHQIYRYDSEVALPLYQHYHKTNETYEPNENVMDGRLLKSKILYYINSHKSYINYGDISSGNYIKNNLVHIEAIGDKKIITPCNIDKLKYDTDNGVFLPNSNLFNAFDNSKFSIDESDPYPLVTIYGTDSVVDKKELAPSWSILIYEMDNNEEDE